VNALEVSALKAGYGSLGVLAGCRYCCRCRGRSWRFSVQTAPARPRCLRALSGVLKHSGSIRLNGVEISGASAARRVALGLAHVPQGRGTFAGFTVEENLWLGAYTVADRSQIEGDIEVWFATFPQLKARRSQLAGSLSGGEQQMLAVARP